MKAAIGLVFGFLSLVVSAQSTLGILDVVGKQGVSKADASALTDFVYDAAYKLGKDKYTIIARNQRDAVLQEQEFSLSDACDEQRCALQVGRYLAADYVITGTFQEFGTKYYVSLMMVNVNTTEVEGTARYGAANYDGVEQSVNDCVSELFGSPPTATTAVQNESPETPDRLPAMTSLLIEPDEMYTPNRRLTVSTSYTASRVLFRGRLTQLSSDSFLPGKHTVLVGGGLEFEHEFEAGISYVFHPYYKIPTRTNWGRNLFLLSTTVGVGIGVIVDFLLWYRCIQKDCGGYSPTFRQYMTSVAFTGAIGAAVGLPLWITGALAERNRPKPSPEIEELNKTRGNMRITNTTTGEVDVIPIE